MFSKKHPRLDEAGEEGRFFPRGEIKAKKLRIKKKKKKGRK